MIYTLNDFIDLSPYRTVWVKVSQPYCNYPSSKILCLCAVVVVRCPPVLTNVPVWLLRLPVYVRGTLQWINPAAVGHQPGLGYSLGCTLPVRPLRFCYAKWLCPCMELSNPRGTVWKSQEALSIYIWMMSAEIFGWYLTRSMPILCFSEFHSVAVHSTRRESYPQCSFAVLCPLQSL